MRDGEEETGGMDDGRGGPSERGWGVETCGETEDDREER